jgi:hypothetical protein
MLSIGLWRRYINITIRILDIIHRPVLYLKHDVSETGFCLRLQVEITQVGPIERASLCLCAGTQTTSFYWADLKTETIQPPISRVEYRAIDNVQNCGSYVTIVTNLQMLLVQDGRCSNRDSNLAYVRGFTGCSHFLCRSLRSLLSSSH